MDPGGGPVPDAYVKVMRKDTDAFERTPVALSAVDGAFTIDKLVAGTYIVTATAKSGGEASSEVETGHATKITIAAPATMEGTVHFTRRVLRL